MEQVLTPKYQIGQTIFQAYTESEQREHDCPDCLGAKKWKVLSPAGAEHTVKCPRCQGGYWGDSSGDKIPSLRYRFFVPRVRELKITGYCVNEYNSGKVKYSSATSSHSSFSFDEADIIIDREAAERVAELKAAHANKEEGATIEHLVGRHFGNLTIDDARIEVFRSEMWNAHYHLGNIMSSLREMFEQAEGWDEQTLRDQVAEKVRWDFDYHLKNMPLAPLFKAVEALIEALDKNAVELSERFNDLDEPGEAVRAAWYKLPDTVRLIIGEELLEAARKKVGY